MHPPLSAFFCYHSNIASPIRCFNNNFTLPLLYRQYKSGNFFGLASDFNFHFLHLLLSCHRPPVQLLQAGDQLDGLGSGLHLLKCVLVHALAHAVDADHALHVLLRQAIHGGIQGIAFVCHSQHSFLWVAPTTIPAASPEWFRPVPPGHHRVGCGVLPSAVY
nr:MAG TPA: hypothetical protein [Caudoviricetes sp.]